MRFGIFDHLDDSGVPLGQLFEERLKLIEAYDRAGFYGYHLAEHHNTPLGYAPSPSVFLSAQISMLGQMSRRRLPLRVGRGLEPVEVDLFGAEHARGMQEFPGALEVI